MKSRTTLEKISGDRGSRVLTPDAYTQDELKGGFFAYRPSADGVSTSVLKSVTGADKDLTDGADTLVKHITGGAATLLTTVDLIECQEDSFTEITFANQNITIYF